MGRLRLARSSLGRRLPSPMGRLRLARSSLGRRLPSPMGRLRLARSSLGRRLPSRTGRLRLARSSLGRRLPAASGSDPSCSGTNLRAVLESLDAGAVRRWCAAGLDALRRHQVEIDELNVYPVPDGDTGTNLVLTVTSAWQALDAEADAGPATPVERVVRCMARGA